MFNHILIPTDGSPVSKKAIRAGVEFAKEIGARVTGYYALEPGAAPLVGEGYRFPDPSLAGEEREASARYLEEVRRIAHKLGVEFDSLVGETANAAQGIADAAHERNCDVIFMATHGRRGLERLVEGSVAAEVVTRSSVPVLVYR
jgi:nucleotide-binding universal stress UspA family protein